MAAKKVSFYLPEEQVIQLKEKSELFGTTFTGVLTIAVKLGLQTMILAVDPKMKLFFQSQIEEALDDL